MSTDQIFKILFTVCHAEYNVITSYRGVKSLKGCVLYVTLSPCNVCAKLIAQTRLKKVIYRNPYDKTKDEECNYKLTEKIFQTCGIKFELVKSILPILAYNAM